ncbi:MAG: M20 family metallopeptidase [Firmicutes bacterium]|nr:M20 family metallopeptidase [Bacillota bacterium]
MSTIIEKLQAHIREEDLVKWTADMVRIESHAEIPQQETGVAKYIHSVFTQYGIPCELKEVVDGRCNVIAWLDSGNPGQTLMFNGHMDTIRADGMEDAFEPKIIDGKLYGRGSSDMKGPIATAMGAMIALKESGLLQKGKVIFTGVLDEEEKSLGTIDILESGITADAAIVCEPSELKICNTQRGLEWFQFHFQGKTVHGGRQKEGINAIAKAVAFINAMEESLVSDVFDRGGTVNYGVIHGGTQLSTVAGECDLYVDRRFTGEETYEEMTQEFQSLLDQLAAKDPQFHCEMKVMKESVMKEGFVHMPMFTDLNEPIVKITESCMEKILGGPVEYMCHPCWTDGGLLSTYGKIPTIVFGPGEIECCHGLHEFIRIEQLTKVALVYALIAESFCHEFEKDENDAR